MLVSLDNKNVKFLQLLHLSFILVPTYLALIFSSDDFYIFPHVDIFHFNAIAIFATLGLPINQTFVPIPMDISIGPEHEDIQYWLCGVGVAGCW